MEAYQDLVDAANNIASEPNIQLMVYEAIW